MSAISVRLLLISAYLFFALIPVSSFADLCKQTFTERYPQIAARTPYFEFKRPSLLSDLEISRLDYLLAPLEEGKWRGSATEHHCGDGDQSSTRAIKKTLEKTLEAALDQQRNRFELTVKIRDPKKRRYRIEKIQLDWSLHDLRQRLARSKDKIHLIQLLPYQVKTLAKQRTAASHYVKGRRSSVVQAVVTTLTVLKPEQIRLNIELYRQDNLVQESTWILEK